MPELAVPAIDESRQSMRAIVLYFVGAYAITWGLQLPGVLVQKTMLVALADTIEDWNVRRLELARELADLRGVSWQTVLEELNLGPAPTHA